MANFPESRRNTRRIRLSRRGYARAEILAEREHCTVPEIIEIMLARTDANDVLEAAVRAGVRAALAVPNPELVHLEPQPKVTSQRKK